MSSDSSHSIVAPLCYMSENPKYEREIPYFLLEVEPTLEVPSTNIEHVTYDVVIENMRNKSETLSIDANGFKLVDWPSKISMDSDYEEVKNYCREMASLVAKELHAEEVLVFDFRVSDPFCTSNVALLNHPSSSDQMSRRLKRFHRI